MIGAHGAIIMFDISSQKTYGTVTQWYKKLLKVSGNIPTVVLGNKQDVINKNTFNKRRMIFCQKKNCKYMAISANNGDKIEKVFLFLLRTIFDIPCIEFVYYTCCFPICSKEEIEGLEEEIRIAESLPLPDFEDDEFL